MPRIPILALGDVLLVSLQEDLHDRLALELQDQLTERIASTGATGVIIEISALETVDSFMARVLAELAAMARLLDADAVLAGIQPAVAMTLVELGLSLPGIRTALNVDVALTALTTPAGPDGHSGPADATG